MLTTGVFLCLVALALIADRLQRIQRSLDEARWQSEAARQQLVVDEIIRDACPTIFFQFREELRRWVVARNASNLLFASPMRSGAVGDLSPGDRDGSWGGIFVRQVQTAPEEVRREFELLASVTEAFVSRAEADTALTAAEINFLAFREWRGLFDGITVDREYVQVMREHIQGSLDTMLAVYRRRPV